MKKILSIALAFMMSISAVTIVCAVEYGEEYTNKPTKTYKQQFNDVSESHWAFSYIGEMTARAVVSGYPNGNFYPDNDVTRAEFARIMTSASGLPISTPTTPDFSDVAVDAWYAPYVHAAYPYLSGYQMSGGNYYKPDTPALREDIAVALVKLKGYDTLGADESILATMFTDVTSISADARKYVAVALERGLVSGYEDDTFRGQDSISRAEATAMLWRAYQYGNDNKTFNSEPTAAPVIATPVPVVTPTPVVTEKPIVVATEVPLITDKPVPTLEPISIEEPVDGKPYVMDTVASCKDVRFMTSDGESIYYYDREDNAIYVINDYNVSEYMDMSLLEVEVGEEIYKDLSVEGLYFDKSSSRVLVSGMFQFKSNPGGLKDKEIWEEATIDIADAENVSIAYKIRDGIEYIFENGNVLAGDNIYDGEGNFITNIDYYDEEYISYMVSGNDIYQFTKNNKILKYDFNRSSWVLVRDVLAETDDYDMYSGVHNGEWYIWYEDGRIIKADKEGNLSETDINTTENVEIVDFKKHPENSEIVDELYITSDGMYFVDYNSKSIRVVRKA